MAWTAEDTITAATAGGSAASTGIGIGIGAAVAGPAGAAIGGAIGQGVGSLGQAIAGLFRKPKVSGPSAQSRIQEAQMRYMTDTMSDSLTPMELSNIATRERAELASIEQELFDISQNPNIAPTTVLKARTSSASGLANMFARQRGETAQSEIEARKMRADLKTQALSSLAQVATANAEAIQMAEAMRQSLRTQQIAAVGESVAASGLNVASAIKAKVVGEDATRKEQLAEQKQNEYQEAMLKALRGEK